MISLLRTKLPAILPKPPSSFPTTMSASGSSRLLALAQQFRLYEPPAALSDEIEEQAMEETVGKVITQVGFQESATPIANQSDRFRPKRAAVLVCIFEGDCGEFRVILTKRSSRLSTHSGEVSLPGKLTSRKWISD
ncbi:unnamed protein product [Linum tenue]|uniref:Nudix hydrolase domain-containing protein n=1 Tax=Linum tenue TaxID=586396 RepID=A0AAV0GUK7_9ROSI|nr:unnamed protein product [Linum tenue]